MNGTLLTIAWRSGISDPTQSACNSMPYQGLDAARLDPFPSHDRDGDLHEQYGDLAHRYALFPSLGRLMASRMEVSACMFFMRK